VKLSKKQLILLISICAVLVIAAAVFFIFFYRSDGDISVSSSLADARRENTLRLASVYAESGEFGRALDLIDSLLIDNPDDEAARALQRAILNIDRNGIDSTEALLAAQRQFLEEQMRQNQELASSLNRPVIVQTQGSSSANDEAAALRRAAAEAEAAEIRRAAAEADAQAAAIRRATAEAEEAASRRAAEAEAEAAAARRATAEAEEARRKAQEEELARASAALQEVMRAVNNHVADGVAMLNSGNMAGANQAFSEAKRIMPPGESRFEAQTLSNIADAYYNYSINNPASGGAREAVTNAVQYANDAISKDPTQALPHYVLGKVSRDSNQNDQAISSFREAARLDSGNYIYQHDLARVLFIGRRYAEARDYFQNATRINPNSETSWYNLGGTYRALNRPDDALAAYRQAVAIKADYAVAHREIGRILITKGDLRGAITSLNTALQISPNDFSTLCELAAAYSQAGNFSEAEDLFTRALRINPSDAQTNYNIATVKLELKKYNEAINHANIAVNANQANSVYVYTLAVALEATGANDLAVSAYKSAAAIDTRYLRPRINLGSLYLTMGRLSDAITYLNEAYAIEPSNFEVNNNLGAVYSRQENWTYSIVHYERALSVRNNDAMVHFNLARAYAGAGDLQKALTSYQSVLRLAPDNWDAMYELGMTCITLGHNTDARRYLQDLISRNPNYSGRMEAERILRSL